jgi:twitching motility protein PilT
MEINKLFKASVDKGASDLHLVVGHYPIARVSSAIKHMDEFDILTTTEAKRMIESILTPQQKKKFQEEKELDFSYEINNVGRFRVNLFWEKDNIGLVARIISNDIPSLEQVGLNDTVERIIKDKQGLILVTGPTGCGKSTSLASMISHINKNQEVSIITLEDPIEYLFPKEKGVIVQRQLGTDMLSFAAGLKHVLRQDPDVIMVGEMRDLETIAMTLTLAETGHLVLATLHTPNASQVIDRIVDVFPPHQQEQVRLQFSMVLNAVIAQQLIPKKGGGLIAAREILINSPAVSNIIRENKIPQINTVMQTSADQGMITMNQSIKLIYEEGLIDEKIAQSFLVSDVLE